MAEQNQITPESDRLAPISAVENELPAYRAVSSWAVGSFVLGLVGIMSFASWGFLAASVGAVICGFVALRMLGRYPDLLTGRGLANAGIALGLIFGLSSATVAYTQQLLLEKEIKRFAAEYGEILEEGSLANVLYMQAPPSQRKEMTPDEFLKMLQAEGPEGMEGDPRTQAVRGVLDFLKGPKQGHAHFVQVEKVGYDGLTPFGFFVMSLETTDPTKEQASEFAGIEVRGQTQDGKRAWFVESIVFPYKAGSIANVVESAHGHDH